MPETSWGMDAMNEPIRLLRVVSRNELVIQLASSGAIVAVRLDESIPLDAPVSVLSPAHGVLHSLGPYDLRSHCFMSAKLGIDSWPVRRTYSRERPQKRMKKKDLSTT